MSNNIGNNDAMAQGAENGSGVRGRHHMNVKPPLLSPELRMVIPTWMQPNVRRINYSANQSSIVPITYEIRLEHYERDERTVSTINVEGVEDINSAERLETIIEE